MTQERPTGVAVLSAFFMFGAIMSGLTAFLLRFPGTVLDSMWRLNDRAHERLAAIGFWGVLLMAAVCAMCGAAAFGLWRCTRWGLWIAVAVLSINLVGDLANAAALHDSRTLIGLPIGGSMLAYLVMNRRVLSR